MSIKAQQAIAAADAVAGYDAYIELITDLLAGKQVVSTGMMQEIDRCRAALEIAMTGKHVAVVSSGDPGIYGMAGLVYELAGQVANSDCPEIEVIPGISAVSASAAILGAPLMHDFAVISLSDLLTPWEVIKKRAAMAAEGDFVMAIYNPKSSKRVTHIEEVRRIVLEHRSPDTPVGIVRQATRSGETAVVRTLADFTEEYIDMFSLVIIGNSQTYVRDGRMITPRGYVL